MIVYKAVVCCVLH